MSTNTIQLPSTNTTTFKTALKLQTPKPTTSSVTASLLSSQDANEARYWMSTYGLGSHHYRTAKKTIAHPRRLLLRATEGTAIIQQVLFGPTTTEHNKNSPPLAVVGGPRVHLYGTNSVSPFSRQLAQSQLHVSSETHVEADRQIQTGGHLSLTSAFRNDGRLLAIGTDVGEIKVCDVTMRATLCTLGAGSCRLPVRAVEWFRDGQHLLAGGDSAVLTVFNIASMKHTSIGMTGSGGGDPLMELKGHGDSVRATVLYQNTSKIRANSEWNNVAFSGSYDGTVRVWNVHISEDDAETEKNRCMAVLQHGAPVEALVTMPSTNPDVPVWLVSAGGVTLKVWNPFTGTCNANIQTQHRKTVTCLLPIVRQHLSPDGSVNERQIPMWRIVTGSLDGCLRIHEWNGDTGAVQHLHGIQVGVGTPLTSLACTPDGRRLAIGTTAGHVLVRQRGPTQSQSAKRRRTKPFAGTYAHFARGANVSYDPTTAVANQDYLLAPAGKKRKLRKYDICLKQFRYGDALDEAMETKIPQVVVAVFEELGKRRGLTIALSHRDEESLEPILAFLVRYLTRPRFTLVLLGVAHILLDMYGEVAGQSETIDELLLKLQEQVRSECRAQKSLLQLLGQLDAIMASDSIG